MISEVPAEIVLEIIHFLRFDPPALSSCSLVSQHLAQVCRKYLYGRLELKNTISLRERYNKLFESLSNNPSLTEYTSDLRLYMGYASQYVARNDTASLLSMQVERDFCLAFDPKLAHFLDFFHKVEKLTLACQRHATIEYIVPPVEKSISRVFALPTLRYLSLENVPMFPVALLRYATRLTYLNLSSISLDPSRTFFGCPDPPTPIEQEPPLDLSVSTCRSDPVYVLTELLGNGGRLSHYCKRINRLLLKPREGKLSDIKPYFGFLDTISAVQKAGKATPLLKHLTLALGDVDYARLGPYIPTTISSFLFDACVLGWHFDGRGREAIDFFNKLPKPWPHLRQFEFRVHAAALEKADSTCPGFVSLLDTLLSSKDVYPSLEGCQCTIVFDRMWLIHDDVALVVGMDGVGQAFETSLRSWFASLNSSGRLAVTWELED